MAECGHSPRSGVGVLDGLGGLGAGLGRLGGLGGLGGGEVQADEGKLIARMTLLPQSDTSRRWFVQSSASVCAQMPPTASGHSRQWPQSSVNSAITWWCLCQWSQSSIPTPQVLHGDACARLRTSACTQVASLPAVSHGWQPSSTAIKHRAPSK